MANEQVSIVLSAVNRASGPIGDVRGSLGDLERSANGLLSRGLNPLKDMLGIGLKAAAGGAVLAFTGLAAGLAGSISGAADMEQRIANISAAMGTGAEATGQLKDLIMDLGLDPTLKVSATEASDAIMALGTAGLTTQQILDGAAKSTVLLANATGADFGSAANIATDAMAQFGIQAGDMQSAIDGIVGTTIASKLDIDGYRLAIGQAGGVAAGVGVEFEDFNTTLAAIIPQFAGGSDAGTGFKTFLQTLIPKSKDARIAMEKLGLITADGSNQFFDAAGNMKDMASIAGILNKALAGLSDEAKNNMLSTIFGTDAARAAIGLSKYTEETFRALGATIASTDAQEQAKIRMATFSGALEILGGTFQTISLMIGDKFLPKLTDMVGRFNDFVSGVGPKVIEWAGLFADNLGALVEYLFAVAEDGDTMNDWLTHMHPNLQAVVLATVGFVDATRGMVAAIGEFFSPITDLIAKYVSWKDVLIVVAGVIAAIVIPAVASFVAAMAPVLLVVAGAIAIVATLRNAWESDFGGIQEKTRIVLDWIQGRFGPLFTAIQEFGGGALREIVAWATGNQTSFTNVGAIWEQAKILARNLFGDLVSTVTTNLPIWRDNLLKWAGAAWQWIVTAGPVALAKMGEFLGGLIGFLGERLPDFLAATYEWATGLVQWIIDAIPKAFKALNDFVFGITTEGKTNSNNAFLDMVGKWARTLYEWITKDLIPKVGPEFVKFGAAILEALGKILTELMTFGLKMGVTLILGVAQGLLDMAGIKVNLNSMRDTIFTTIDGFKQGMYDKAGQLVGKIKDGINAFIADPRAALTNGLNGMRDQFNALSGSFKPHFYAVSGEFMQRIRDGINVYAPQARDAINNGLTALGAAFNSKVDGSGSLKDRFYTGARDMTLRIRDGFNAVANDPAGALGAIIKRVTDTFNAVANSLKNHFYAVARDMIWKIRDGLNAVANDPAAAVLAIITRVTDTFNSVTGNLKNHFWGVAGDLGRRISEGLSSANPAAAVGGLLQRIIDEFNNSMNRFKDHVWGVMKGIGQSIA
ncbi:MAG: phage tail tape measure protein, partial [Sterolibacterium sp.]|nr:phage tail tape measure protein [Sterolibacterium sp.]